MNCLAKKLPFDILCIVFDYYAEFDSPAQPLETVLLVCKSWYNAASDHKELWSRFNMDISQIEFAVYWTACVPRRLSRTSPNGLLDITIHLRIQFITALEPACDTLLYQLVGESGEVARRWRRIHMSATGPCAHYLSPLLIKYLCYSTPYLQEFKYATYAGLGGVDAILPDTSSLKTFHAMGLEGHPYPDLSHVTDLEIQTTSPSHYIDERGLALAVNVERMRLCSSRPYRLTTTYMRLRTFEIEGDISEDCLTEFCAPNLSELVVELYNARDYTRVASCKGIKLTAIRKLRARLALLWTNRAEMIQYRDAIRPLLMSMTSLEVLDLGGGHFYPIILKLLTDDLQSLYQSHTLTLKLEGVTAELGGNESSISSINKFREKFECPGDQSWDELFNFLLQSNGPCQLLNLGPAHVA